MVEWKPDYCAFKGVKYENGDALMKKENINDIVARG